MNTYLFFDDFMIDCIQSFRKRQFKANKVSTFHLDQITGGHSVVKIGNKYFMYYTTISDYSKDWNRMPYYSTSDDGFHFTVIGPMTGMPVPGFSFVNQDNHTENDEERFKTVIMKVGENEKKGSKGYVATSPDFLNWKINMEYRICDHASDTTNNIFYNPVLKKYQVIYRGAFIDRRISTIFSDDLKTWSDPILIMSPTPFDEPLTQYYGMVVYPFNGILLGSLQLYHTDPNDFVQTKMIGKTDAALVYSYNGINWNRASNEFMIERSIYPEYGSGGLYPMNMVESIDGRDWIIGVGSVINDHGCGFSPAYPDWDFPEASKEIGNTAICFYKIRKFGFTGLESYGYKSYIRFRKIQILGKNITFNGISSFGYIKFQIKDEKYNIIDGF
ncbi:MAG: hypothetical protein JXQ23_05390, partial [Clostridia bacterium]|nr:hypothetical protein [Clostridia bacterium]